MSNTIFKDLLFIIVFGFLFLLIVIILFINKDNSNPGDLPNIGEIFIMIEWETSNDFDLWVGNEHEAVGYRRPQGEYFALLRDSRGEDSSNFEVVVGNDVSSGEYHINVDNFHGGSASVSLKVIVNNNIVYEDTRIVSEQTNWLKIVKSSGWGIDERSVDIIPEIHYNIERLNDD